MRITLYCAAVLFTLVQSLPVDTATGNLRQFDFHVKNLQLNGVQRTVINGPSQYSHIFLSNRHPETRAL